MTGKVIILAAGSVIISFLLSREIIHKPVRSVINAVYLLGIFLIFGMASGIFGIRSALSSLWILTVFLHLAVYYSILLCADSLLRNRYSPNLLVILWLFPCVLFYQTYGFSCTDAGRDDSIVQYCTESDLCYMDMRFSFFGRQIRY